MSGADYPVTPDGRYFVVRGRLWRKSNPALAHAERQALVKRLMAARRVVRDALRVDDRDALAGARAEIDTAKIALGERGPVWWTDGGPDLNRHMARTTAYADWFASIEREGRGTLSPAAEPLRSRPTPSSGDTPQHPGKR